LPAPSASDVQAAPSNAGAAWLLSEGASLTNAGMNRNELILALPPCGHLVLATHSDLDAWFAKADQYARLRIIEVLLECDDSDRAFRMIGQLPHGTAEHGALASYASIVQSYREFDYESGRALARRCVFTRDQAWINNNVLRWVAFDFLDMDLAGDMLADPARAIDADVRRHVEGYSAMLRATSFVGSEGGLSTLEGQDFTTVLRTLRNGTALPLLPEAAAAVVATLDKIGDWHVRQALLSFAGYCASHARTSDLEVSARVLSGMVNLGREKAAACRLLHMPIAAAGPVTFDQFKGLQKAIMATSTQDAKSAAITHIRTQLASQMNPEMLAALTSMEQRATPVQKCTPWPLRRGLTARGRQRTRDRVLGQPVRGGRPGAFVMPSDGVSVAICISGQLRAFHRTWPTIRDHVAKPLGADVFISTWDKIGCSVGYQQETSRFLPPELLHLLPAQYAHAPALFAAFPTLARAAEGYRAGSREILESTQGVEAWRVWDEPKFARYIEQQFQDPISERRQIRDRATAGNQVKMFFTMWDAFRLAQENASLRHRRYDIILRMRPDMRVTDFCAESLVRSKLDAGTVYINHYHAAGISDQFAFGSEAAMSHYSSAFECIEAVGSFDAFPAGFGAGGESMMFDNLASRGVRCCRRDIIAYELSSVVWSASECARMMLADMNGSDELATRLGRIAEGSSL